MASRFLCPGCGNSVNASATPGDRIICLGCGKSLGMVLPAEPPTVRPAYPGMEVGDSGDAIDDAVSFAPAAFTPYATVARPSVQPHRHGMPHWVPVVTVLSAAVLIGGAVAAVVYSKSPEKPVTVDVAWDVDHRPDLRRLKTDAETKALAGDLRGAYADYQAIDTMVASHTVADPETSQLIQAARQEKSEIYKQLLSSGSPTGVGSQPPAISPARIPSPDPQPPASNGVVPTSTHVDPVEPAPQSPVVTAAPTVPPVAVQPLPPAPAPVLPPPSAAVANPTVPLAVNLPGHEADRKIGQSLDAGVNFLISRFNNGQIADGLGADDVRHQGLDALCVYALLHASQGSPDPRLNIHGPLMVQLLATLKSFPMAGRDPTKPMAPAVYAHSLRAAALAVYNRPEDHKQLQADVNWLVNAAVGGAYTYDDRYSNSNRTSASPGASGSAAPVGPTVPGSDAGSNLSDPTQPQNAPTQQSDQQPTVTLRQTVVVGSTGVPPVATVPQRPSQPAPGGTPTPVQTTPGSTGPGVLVEVDEHETKNANGTYTESGTVSVNGQVIQNQSSGQPSGTVSVNVPTPSGNVVATETWGIGTNGKPVVTVTLNGQSATSTGANVPATPTTPVAQNRPNGGSPIYSPGVPSTSTPATSTTPGTPSPGPGGTTPGGGGPNPGGTPQLARTMPGPLTRTMPGLERTMPGPMQRTMPGLERTMPGPLQRTMPGLERTMPGPMQRTMPDLQQTIPGPLEPTMPGPLQSDTPQLPTTPSGPGPGAGTNPKVPTKTPATPTTPPNAVPTPVYPPSYLPVQVPNPTPVQPVTPAPVQVDPGPDYQPQPVEPDVSVPDMSGSAMANPRPAIVLTAFVGAMSAADQGGTKSLATSPPNQLAARPVNPPPSPFSNNQPNNPAPNNNGTNLPAGTEIPQITPDMLKQLGQSIGNGQIPWDNSNSQYGLLGVWSGAEVGCEVPNAYWKAVEAHWQSCELPTGQWCYSAYDPAPMLSMSCAGTASLLITHEWLDWPAMGTRVGRQPYSNALVQALRWLESGDNSVNVVTPDLHYLGYTAYGIERTALASGFKYFGTHDWYAELAASLSAYQFPTGAWGNVADGTDSASVNTAYMVLFLSRGRHPVLMNKLRFDPYWDNRPKDVANLAKYAGIELERPFNWQVVSTVRPWSDWMDSPILYIASHKAPNLTDEDLAKIKAFADAGGLIFTHSDSNSVPFNTWVDALQKKLWPQYPLQAVPRDSAVYNSNYHLAADKKLPGLKGISNGSRYLLVHCPTDNLSVAWQDAMTTQKDDFQMGINLFVYAAGRSNFRNRLDSPFIPEPTTPAASTIRVARLKYDGNWDPEPYAYTRFDRYLHWTVGTALDIAPVDLAALADLKPADRPVAILTGNAAITFTDAQAAAVAAYVKAGGTVLIDSTGGNPDFAKSAAALIAKAIPDTPLTDVPATDPLLAGGGPVLDPLPKPVGRPFNTETQVKTVQIQMIHPPGTGRVIFTPLDLTTGLLGTQTWGIAGYDPEYAQKLVKNVVETAGMP